ILSFFLSRRMVPLIRESNTRRSRLLASYVDFMANITTVKKLGLQRYVGKKLATRSNNVNEQIDRVQKFHAERWFFQHGLFGVAYLATVGFLIYQIGLGLVSASLLILFIAAYGTLRGLIEQLSEMIKSLMEMRVYVEQLEEILRDERTDSGRSAVRDWKYINFSDVEFRYDDGLRVSVPRFTLERGKVAVLTGKSGQGKSTFINLFMNGLESNAGIRRMSDYNYDQLGTRFFEDSVALVAQDIELFNISLRENIELGKHVQDSELWVYLEELGLRSWAEGLEDGLDTIVGEKGAKLSAGQKQRLSILRAIVLDRPILVLDEPTSNLDSHTETIVIEFIRRHAKDATILIVTHRPALLELADVSYEMSDHTLRQVS
ncbi:MAG: ABC transporter ATP-binding protein, partial [Candidatus Saccharimonas sp.]